TGAELLDLDYQWDSLGRVTQKTDANGARDASGLQVADHYTYDALGRLTSYTVSGGSSTEQVNRRVDLHYNALGMIVYKSDGGNYRYPAQGVAQGMPHALQALVGGTAASYQYDLNGNLTSASAGPYRSLSYTSFNLPASQPGVQGPSGRPAYDWVYDENHQRTK